MPVVEIDMWNIKKIEEKIKEIEVKFVFIPILFLLFIGQDIE